MIYNLTKPASTSVVSSKSKKNQPDWLCLNKLVLEPTLLLGLFGGLVESRLRGAPWGFVASHLQFEKAPIVLLDHPNIPQRLLSNPTSAPDSIVISWGRVILLFLLVKNYRHSLFLILSLLICWLNPPIDHILDPPRNTHCLGVPTHIPFKHWHMHM